MLFRPARASEIDEICSLLATTKRKPEDIYALLQSDPHFDASQFRTAWTEGRVVACAKIYPRLMRIGPTTIPIGGIGNVRSDPQYWQHGLAISLLAECLTAMRLEGIALAPLFAKQQSLYHHCGWHAIPATSLEIAATALVPDQGARQEIAVRPLTQRDVGRLVDFEHSVNATRSGTIVRGADEWNGYRRALKLQGATIFLAKKAQELLGFAVAQIRDKGVEIRDVALAPHAVEPWRALLPAIMASTESLATLCVGLPADYRASITGALGGHAIARQYDDLMLRAIDSFHLLQQLVPVLSERLRDEPVSTPMRVRFGPLHGGVVLHVEGTTVEVERPQQRENVAELPESMFLNLLLGVEGMAARLSAQTPATDGIPLTAKARATLARLFPSQNWALWRSDTF